MCVSPWFLFVVTILLFDKAHAWDGCDFNHWRCGDTCIDLIDSCKCGDESFGHKENFWCCHDSGTCSQDDSLGGVQCNGTKLKLTEPCREKCNIFPHDEYRNYHGVIRAFVPCTTTVEGASITQCVPEAKVNDGSFNCRNRGDEKPFLVRQHITNISALLLPCTIHKDEGYWCSKDPDKTSCEPPPGSSRNPHYCECKPLTEWCNPTEPFFCSQLVNTTFTSLSTDSKVCGDPIFWEGKSCGAARKVYARCTGVSPGECWSEVQDLPCSDGSNTNRPPPKSIAVIKNPDVKCTTKSGPQPNKPCVFPFTYSGKIHKECYQENSSQEPWCSTLVDNSGKHQKGNWGNCGPGCPIKTDVQEPNCGDKPTCIARSGKWEGQKICLEKEFICDNTLQCMGGEDEKDCEETYFKKKIFKESEYFVCHLTFKYLSEPYSDVEDTLKVTTATQRISTTSAPTPTTVSDDYYDDDIFAPTTAPDYYDDYNIFSSNDNDVEDTATQRTSTTSSTTTVSDDYYDDDIFGRKRRRRRKRDTHQTKEGNEKRRKFFPYRAVECDGAKQCPNGEDEAACDIDSIAIIFLGAAFGFLACVTFVSSFLLVLIFGKGVSRGTCPVQASRKIRLYITDVNQNDIAVDRKLLDDSHVGEAIMQWQTLGLPRDKRREFHQNLVRSIALAEGGLAEAFIFMKAKFPPAANKAILSDFDYTGSNMNKALDAIDDTVKKVKKSLEDLLNSVACIQAYLPLLGELARGLTRLLFVVGIYVELIKDSSLMAALISIEQDNDISLLTFTFTKTLTIVMGVSVFTPLAISAIETAWRRPWVILGCEPWIRYKCNPPSTEKLWAIRVFNICFYFAIPAITINARERARSKLAEELKRGKLEAIISGDNSVSKAHLQKIREIHEFLQESTNAILTFKRNELGIEVLTQIVIQLMMVMLSPKFTVSATHSGLQALFESDDSALQFWLGINGIILILGSIGWSFKTTAASYVNVKTEEKIEFYPMLPKLVLGVRTLLIVTVRICCTICYFAPFLGLMDSLAHWKADQLLLPGDQPRSTGIPEYTDYTLISLGTAFLIFLGAMVVQSIIILFVKRQMNGQFRKAYWSCKLQHIVEVFNMPDTFLDWDTRPGSPAQHKRRWQRAMKESMVMILIHHIANLLLLVPLFVTAKNVFAKHQENIMNGVNIFEKEEEAVSLLTMLEWMMPLVIHITSLVDVFLALVYQKYFHPWRRILAAPEPEVGKAEKRATSLMNSEH